MNKIKIVHSGDFHLDSPFSSFPKEIAAIRRQEQLQTFSTIINYSKDADMLFLCGDIFDSFDVSIQTLYYMKKCFEKIHDVPVFIVPGNHDFYCDNSPYSYFDFGSNVHIFGSDISCIEFEDIRVFGVGFSTRYIKDSVLKDFCVPDKDKLNVMLLHGEIADYGDYNPISLSDIKNSGLDYLALGHKHKYSGIKKEGCTSYAYPGIPEGRGFDECGDCGFISAEFDDIGAKYAFHPVSKRKNYNLTIDINDCLSMPEILSVLPTNENDLFNITLTGKVSSEFYIDCLTLENMATAFFCRIKDNSVACSGSENNYGLLGTYFKEIIENSDICDKEAALKIGYQLLSGGNFQ